MTTHLLRVSLCALALAGGLFGCSNDDDADDEVALEEEAVLDVKDYVSAELQKLVEATEALQAAAPEPDEDGWNAQDDADAVADMREAWADARDAYERVEGSIAILFDELDVSTDERYDGFLAEGADQDLFDGEGVTGMHAIERILWAGEHPANVVTFERALDGYVEASSPKTAAEAEAFKTELAQRLIDDCTTMNDEFEPFALEAVTAYNGVVGSMAEQLEKVTLAVSAEDESRYAQRTLDDMRANLEGGVAVYEAFRPWVVVKSGDALDAQIDAGFEKIADAYAENEGAAIPPVPDTFETRGPSDADLDTEYGKLWKLLTDETDLDADDSLITLLAEAADDLGLELE